MSYSQYKLWKRIKITESTKNKTGEAFESVTPEADSSSAHG